MMVLLLILILMMVLLFRLPLLLLNELYIYTLSLFSCLVLILSTYMLLPLVLLLSNKLYCLVNPLYLSLLVLLLLDILSDISHLNLHNISCFYFNPLTTLPTLPRTTASSRIAGFIYTHADPPTTGGIPLVFGLSIFSILFYSMFIFLFIFPRPSTPNGWYTFGIWRIYSFSTHQQSWFIFIFPRRRRIYSFLLHSPAKLVHIFIFIPGSYFSLYPHADPPQRVVYLWYMAYLFFYSLFIYLFLSPRRRRIYSFFLPITSRAGSYCFFLLHSPAKLVHIVSFYSIHQQSWFIFLFPRRRRIYSLYSMFIYLFIFIFITTAWYMAAPWAIYFIFNSTP